MNTKNRIKKVLTLAVVAMAVILTATSANAGLIVYEGFQYSNVGDILTGQPDGAGTPADIDATGLAGTYAASTTSEQLEIYAGSLTFGDLPVLGNCIGSDSTSGDNRYMRNLTAGAQSSVSSAGEIWFSIVIQPNDSSGNSEGGFAITNQTLTQTKINNNTAVGGLVGFAVGSEGNSNFQPYVWDGTTIATGTTANPALSTTDGTNYLLVGHISFDSGGGGADVYKLYNYELNAGSVVGGTLTQIGDTLEVDLDQSTLDRIQFTRQRRPSYDELRIGTTLGIVLGGIDPMEPSPEDGGQVSASSTQVLSWTNLPPTTGSDVWVDVYFGTDANALDALITNPEDGLNVTSVTVDASVIGQTYYWQVDSYINGSRIGDPNEGTLYTFYAADLPPSIVDAGVDMITWYGQGVQLDATVGDDGVSALTYLWSAVPAEGVVFSDETAEAPIVTISKASYSAARIVNAGFEDAVHGDGTWGAAPGWSAVSAGSGSWNPGTSGTIGYGGDAPEGENIGWGGADTGDDEGGLAQVLTETLASDTTYTLTVEVGNSPLYDWGGYKVQLLAGGTVLAEDLDTVTIADNTFETVTVTHTSGGVSDPNVGQPLEIRLITIGIGAYTEANFDDVRLTADPGFPAPAVGIVELTLEVTDNVGSLADTMMIDVYGDACKAAIGAGLDPIELTDHDGNCITDLGDLIRMVTIWLDDYSVTEPVVKP